MAEALYPGFPEQKVFTLAASGEVRLYGPEVAVVDSTEFQRLAGIKQLGTSHLVFRTAIHTRFEHSIGTLHMAQTILDRARMSLETLSHEEQREATQLARLGGLLHDLPHLPFGHTLEDEFNLLPRHDHDRARWKRLLDEGELHGVLFAALGEETFEELKRVLMAKTETDIAGLRFPFVADIVGNTVCADLLDYIVRDLEACGMPVALGDRFLSYFVITGKRLGTGSDVDSRRMALRLEKRGMPRPDVESEVVKLLTYRYELAERVYFHHAKNAASVMIGRAVQELGLIDEKLHAATADTRALPFLFLGDGSPLSDDLLLHALANPAIAEASGLRITDDPGRRGRAAALGQAVLGRRLYKLAYLGVHDDLFHRVEYVTSTYSGPEARSALEDRLASELGLDRGEVLVHIPARRMMVKAAEVRVERSDGTVTTLEGWDRSHSKRVDALNDAHSRLWRVMVFVKPAADGHETDKRRQMVGAAAADLFGAQSRYVSRMVPAPLGWHESEAIRGLSFLQAEVAREIAVERRLPVADVEQVVALATSKVDAFGTAPTIEQIRAAWSSALPTEIPSPDAVESPASAQLKLGTPDVALPDE